MGNWFRALPWLAHSTICCWLVESTAWAPSTKSMQNTSIRIGTMSTSICGEVWPFCTFIFSDGAHWDWVKNISFHHTCQQTVPGKRRRNGSIRWQLSRHRQRGGRPSSSPARSTVTQSASESMVRWCEARNRPYRRFRTERRTRLPVRKCNKTTRVCTPPCTRPELTRTQTLPLGIRSVNAVRV